MYTSKYLLKGMLMRGRLTFWKNWNLKCLPQAFFMSTCYCVMLWVTYTWESRHSDRYHVSIATESVCLALNTFSKLILVSLTGYQDKLKHHDMNAKGEDTTAKSLSERTENPSPIILQCKNHRGVVATGTRACVFSKPLATIESGCEHQDIIILLLSWQYAYTVTGQRWALQPILTASAVQGTKLLMS